MAELFRDCRTAKEFHSAGERTCSDWSRTKAYEGGGDHGVQHGYRPRTSHRFVGNVGWRQNEQPFDSVRVVSKSLANTTLDAAYVSQVSRVFGKESLQGRYEGDSVLTRASCQFGVGAEVLEGDGRTGFTTPLATLKILTPPMNGGDDRYVNAGLTFRGVGPLDTLGALASCHVYAAERGGLAYGSRRLFTDTTRFWVQAEYLW